MSSPKWLVRRTPRILLRAEWATIEKASALPPPRVHPAWAMTKLERLDASLWWDPQRAKVEIQNHLDGDLVIVPRPSSTGGAASRDQRPRKKRKPPEESGGCSPTSGLREGPQPLISKTLEVSVDLI